MTAQQFDAETLTEAEASLGWRRMSVDKSGNLGGLSSEGLSTRARCRLSAMTSPADLAKVHAAQREHGVPIRHRAPHPGCYCGYRVVGTPIDLQIYYSTRETLDQHEAGVVAMVAGFGRVCGSFSFLDPPGTLRVERYRVIALFVPDHRPDLFKRYTARYAVPVQRGGREWQ